MTWPRFSQRMACWLLGAAGFVLLLCQSARADGDIAGNWLAESGRMTLVHLDGRDYEGNYISISTGSIVLRGRLDGQTFDGYWIAPSAPKSCHQARDDSLYWGRMRFDFNGEFTRFAGHWSYCDEVRRSGNWIGKRDGEGLVPEPEPLPSYAISALRDARDLPIGRCGGSDRYALAVHGGAVSGRRGDHSQKVAFIRQLLKLSRQHLADGAGALDVLQGAIRSMEDSGLFNAGRGAIANKAGVVELDASIMEGRLRRAGAVAAVRGVKNAISAARRVMEQSKHVLMVGPAADAFISDHGGQSVGQDYFLKSGSDFSDVPLPEDLEIAPPGTDISPNLAAFSGRWAGRWSGALNMMLAVESMTPTKAEIIYAEGTNPDWGFNFGGWIRLPADVQDGTLHFSFTNGPQEHFTVSPTDDGRLRIAYKNKTSGFSTETILDRWPPVQPLDDHGTVGAVALDRCGDLAAGTSTGGYGSKTPGRVGDSPIIGAGTYADNETAAVSATGHGEYFIRFAVAYDITAMMRYRNVPLSEAATKIIKYKLPSTGLTGGVIALDRNGNVAMPFNTNGMLRGAIGSDLSLSVEVY